LSELKRQSMKKIDTTGMILVHYGREWAYDAPPCSKSMVSKLERNERLVFWLHPKEGTERDQVPALKLTDGFYSLSLRMMKAIWRHVRLKKGFHNLERAQMGGYKLRIPHMLLTEKIRTQSRFNVSSLLPTILRIKLTHFVLPADPTHVFAKRQALPEKPHVCSQ